MMAYSIEDDKGKDLIIAEKDREIAELKHTIEKLKHAIDILVLAEPYVDDNEL